MQISRPSYSTDVEFVTSSLLCITEGGNIVSKCSTSVSVIIVPRNPDVLKCHVCVSQLKGMTSSLLLSLVYYSKCTFSLWELPSKTLLQAWPSRLMVTENSVTIILVSIERAP